MNKFISGALIAVVAFALGVGGTLWYRDMTRPALHSGLNDSVFDQMFNNDFFNRSRDPFQEMERMQKQMNKLFGSDSSRFDSFFNNWFKNEYGDFPAGSITMDEDDGHIYYKMDIGDSKLANVNVQVENGTIMIKATTQSSGSPGAQSYAEINQQFPLPPGVDPKSVKVSQNDGVVTIRLDKTTA